MKPNGNDFDMFAGERGRPSAAGTERQMALYLAKVMGWMCVGLLTTLVSAMLCLSSRSFMGFLSQTYTVFGLCVLQLVVVAGLSFGMPKMSPATATAMFLLYSGLMGITFSSLYLLFELSSIVAVFAVTAVTFVALSVYGFVSKRDLTRMGSLAMCGLIGVLLAAVINLFLRSSMLEFIITVIGLVVFLALTAYDTQRIKAIYANAVAGGQQEDSPELRKLAILGALTLYLDFINLFLRLLQLIGRRRN